MRVGNGFSRVLDPARPALFGDEEGCAPLPDEGWPGGSPLTRAGCAMCQACTWVAVSTLQLRGSGLSSVPIRMSLGAGGSRGREN